MQSLPFANVIIRLHSYSISTRHQYACKHLSDRFAGPLAPDEAHNFPFLIEKETSSTVLLTTLPFNSGYFLLVLNFFNKYSTQSTVGFNYIG
jgi:hypothetical protein